MSSDRLNSIGRSPITHVVFSLALGATCFGAATLASKIFKGSYFRYYSMSVGGSALTFTASLVLLRLTLANRNRSASSSSGTTGGQPPLTTIHVPPVHVPPPVHGPTGGGQVGPIRPATIIPGVDPARPSESSSSSSSSDPRPPVTPVNPSITPNASLLHRLKLNGPAELYNNWELYENYATEEEKNGCLREYYLRELPRLGPEALKEHWAQVDQLLSLREMREGIEEFYTTLGMRRNVAGDLADEFLRRRGGRPAPRPTFLPQPGPDPLHKIPLPVVTPQPGGGDTLPLVVPGPTQPVVVKPLRQLSELPPWTHEQAYTCAGIPFGLPTLWAHWDDPDDMDIFESGLVEVIAAVVILNTEGELVVRVWDQIKEYDATKRLRAQAKSLGQDDRWILFRNAAVHTGSTDTEAHQGVQAIKGEAQRNVEVTKVVRNFCVDTRAKIQPTCQTMYTLFLQQPGSEYNPLARQFDELKRSRLASEDNEELAASLRQLFGSVIIAHLMAGDCIPTHASRRQNYLATIPVDQPHSLATIVQELGAHGKESSNALAKAIADRAEFLLKNNPTFFLSTQSLIDGLVCLMLTTDMGSMASITTKNS